jgi:hypothetical protein
MDESILSNANRDDFIIASLSLSVKVFITSIWFVSTP